MATFIRYTTSSGRSDTLPVDATMARETAKAVEVTKFPIEDGSVVSDHAIRAPDTYRMDGMITNTPTLPAEWVEGLYDHFWQGARDVLEGILERKGVTTIITPDRTYEDMIMTDLRFPEDSSTGDALRFSCSFERLIRVSSQTVQLPKTSKSAKVDGGRKTTEKASPVVERKASLAKQGVDYIRGR